MTTSETKEIIKKIKTFRPYFQTGNGKREEADFLKEWHKVFEPYKYSDVKKRLDNFFKNPDNYGKIPEAHYLVNTLTKTTSKKDELSEITVMCPKCKTELSLEEFNTHFGKCASVEFIYKKTKQYYNLTLSKEKLFALSDEELEDKYLKLIEKLKDEEENEKEKNRLKNLAKLMKGEKVELTIEDVI